MQQGCMWEPIPLWHSKLEQWLSNLIQSWSSFPAVSSRLIKQVGPRLTGWMLHRAERAAHKVSIAGRRPAPAGHVEPDVAQLLRRRGRPHHHPRVRSQLPGAPLACEQAIFRCSGQVQVIARWAACMQQLVKASNPVLSVDVCGRPTSGRWWPGRCQARGHGLATTVHSRPLPQTLLWRWTSTRLLALMGEQTCHWLFHAQHAVFMTLSGYDLAGHTSGGISLSQSAAKASLPHCEQGGGLVWPIISCCSSKLRREE